MKFISHLLKIIIMEQLVKEIEAKMAEFAKNANDQVEEGNKRATHTNNKSHDSQQQIQVVDIEFHNQWNNV